MAKTNVTLPCAGSARVYQASYMVIGKRKGQDVGALSSSNVFVMNEADPVEAAMRAVNDGVREMRKQGIGNLADIDIRQIVFHEVKLLADVEFSAINFDQQQLSGIADAVARVQAARNN